MKHAYLIIVAVSLLVLGSLSFLEKKLDILQPPRATYAAMSHAQDFTNAVEGTFSMNINIGYDVLQQYFGMVPDYLIIFNSKAIEGLRIVYDLKGRFIEGGLPPIKTATFDLFDKQNHRLIYTFKEGLGQKFVFDGRDIGVGPFNPLLANKITGNVVLNIPLTARLPAEISIEDAADDEMFK